MSPSASNPRTASWIKLLKSPWILLLSPFLGVYAVMSTLRPPWYPHVLKLDQVGTQIGKKEEEKEFDVVIVGGGTVGCTLASRLSEDPKLSVLLLEAGESDQLQLFSRIPSTFSRTFAHPSAAWGYFTEPDAQSEDKKSHNWPRSRMLGGCSAINDFEELASLGFPDLSPSSLAPYFAKFQTGKDAPVKIGYSYITKISEAFIEACGSMGIRIRKDVNTDGDGTGDKAGSGTLGVSKTRTFIKDGSRISMAQAYLTPDVIARSNLHVATGATVTRILFDKTSTPPRAIGVEFTALKTPWTTIVTGKQIRYRALAKRDVILSSGSIASPHLLMVSGIGPKEQLERLGVDVISDLQGVGANLWDHVACSVTYEAKKGTTQHYLADPIKSIGPLIEWLRFKTGPLTSNIGETLAFLRSDDQEIAKLTGIPSPNLEDVTSGKVGPEIEYIGAALGFAEHGTLQPPKNVSDYFTIAMLLLRPKSSGRIEITSKDVFVKPKIHAGYFSDEHDVKMLLWAMRVADKIAQSKSLSPFVTIQMQGHSDFAPPRLIAETSDEELMKWIRGHVNTYYHPVGTVKLGGKEVKGCLDPEYRVHGVQSLRVLDASIFPVQLSGHPSAPLIAIAEQFADHYKLNTKI